MDCSSLGAFQGDEDSLPLMYNSWSACNVTKPPRQWFMGKLGLVQGLFLLPKVLKSK